MIELNRIYNEDCLEGMKRIPDGSVDCIICDLPYGVLNKRNNGAKWDNVIPINHLWEQYKRIIKDNGAIVLFGQGMFSANLMMSNPKMWRYNLVWHKNGRCTGFLNAKRAPLREHEDICVFYKKQPVYNPQMVKCEPHQRNHSRGKGSKTNHCYGEIKYTQQIITDFKYPRSVISIKKEHDIFFHPTQKPVALIEYLIKTYSNEGETILDNCMGSGTTAIACMNTNRNFIGFELNKEFYDISLKRIEEHEQVCKADNQEE